MSNMEAKAREYEDQILNDPSLCPPPINISATWIAGYLEAIAEERERCAKIRVPWGDRDGHYAAECYWEEGQDAMSAAIKEDPLDE